MIAKPETDTPETDAAILREINAKLSFGLTGYTAKASGQFVDAEFARKLERERDMSLYDATQETLKVSALKSQWIAVCQERDAAENESLEMSRLLGMSGEREAALLARLDEANREIARLQMELDATCNAEELRQARTELDRLRAALVEAEKDAETLQASNNTYERDWPQLVHERSRWRECAERLAGQMQRLADCDWVITLPDRMDAVRDVARNALAEFDRLKEGSK